MKLQFETDSFTRASEKANRLQPKIRVRASRWRNSWDVRVLGSGAVWYSVEIYPSVVGGLNSVCSCAAGRKGLNCYHVAAAWEMYLFFAANGIRPTFH